MRYSTTLPKTIEAITAHLESLDHDELVNIHNTYCQEQRFSDDEIYLNDEDFFNTFFESKVLEAVRAVCFGEYRYQDEYVIFNGYGNLESFNNPEQKVDIPAIAAAILDDSSPYDIELTECFLLEGVNYEGTREDAQIEYDEYKNEIEEADAELEEGEDPEEILTFERWVEENINTVD